ncbi:MAG: glycosyltransferase family 2 protein [Candidatus Gottesmanbacteria bacterium]|nr:glycosyltransferase family 2 protein [Candidatus Gottesmanbacteria bacterium]
MTQRLPNVTVTIPTFNSAETLAICLHALRVQSYRNIDISIVDSYSEDETVSVAKEQGIKNIYYYRGGLLGSRLQGIMHAKGEYVLLLDSDQILTKHSIAACVRQCERQGTDMIALEEDVYECTNWLQWLFKMDRKVINTVNNLDPETGAILPRFFRKSILYEAMGAIPRDIINSVGGPDHAILYYESRKVSNNVGVVKNAVRHMEIKSLVQFIKKCYRWGSTSYTAKTISKYANLMKRKERFRSGIFTRGLMIASLASLLLLVLKGVPYKIGYTVARIKVSYK